MRHTDVRGCMHQPAWQLHLGYLGCVPRSAVGATGFAGLGKLHLSLHVPRGRLSLSKSNLVWCCRAILLNVNEPETRGIALGMQTVMDDCGRGLGPLLVAFILQVFRGCGPAALICVCQDSSTCVALQVRQ